METLKRSYDPRTKFILLEQFKKDLEQQDYISKYLDLPNQYVMLNLYANNPNRDKFGLITNSYNNVEVDFSNLSSWNIEGYHNIPY
jgi:hypothetical protein